MSRKLAFGIGAALAVVAGLPGYGYGHPGVPVLPTLDSFIGLRAECRDFLAPGGRGEDARQVVLDLLRRNANLSEIKRRLLISAPESSLELIKGTEALARNTLALRSDEIRSRLASHPRFEFDLVVIGMGPSGANFAGVYAEELRSLRSENALIREPRVLFVSRDDRVAENFDGQEFTTNSPDRVDDWLTRPGMGSGLALDWNLRERDSNPVPGGPLTSYEAFFGRPFGTGVPSMEEIRTRGAVPFEAFNPYLTSKGRYALYPAHVFGTTSLLSMFFSQLPGIFKSEVRSIRRRTDARLLLEMSSDGQEFEVGAREVLFLSGLGDNRMEWLSGLTPREVSDLRAARGRMGTHSQIESSLEFTRRWADDLRAGRDPMAPFRYRKGLVTGAGDGANHVAEALSGRDPRGSRFYGPHFSGLSPDLPTLTMAGLRAVTREQFLEAMKSGSTAISRGYFHSVRYEGLADLYGDQKTTFTSDKVVFAVGLPNGRIRVHLEDGYSDDFDFAVDASGYKSGIDRMLSSLDLRRQSVIEIMRPMYGVDPFTQSVVMGGREPRAIARQLVGADGVPVAVWTAGPAAPGLVRPEDTLDTLVPSSTQAIRNPVALRNSAYRLQTLAKEFARRMGRATIEESIGARDSIGMPVGIESARLVQHDVSGLGEDFKQPWSHRAEIWANKGSRYYWEVQVRVSAALMREISDPQKALAVVNVAKDQSQEGPGEISSIVTDEMGNGHIVFRIPIVPQFLMRGEFYAAVTDMAGRRYFSNEGHPTSFFSVLVRGWTQGEPVKARNVLKTVGQ